MLIQLQPHLYNFFYPLGGTETSAGCKKKETRNFRKAHWNTKGKILKLYLAEYICKYYYSEFNLKKSRQTNYITMIGEGKYFCYYQSNVFYY